MRMTKSKLYRSVQKARLCIPLMERANGQASFTLPQGSYRFRADQNGTQFWNVPGATKASFSKGV